MIGQIIAAIVSAVLRFIGESAARQSTARDADADRGMLRRAGRRIRSWVRGKQDGVHPRVESDQDGSQRPR